MTERAFIFARIKPKNEQEVLDQLQLMNGVDYAFLLIGKDDLLAKVSAEDAEILYKQILSKIREIPGLKLTKTFVCRPHSFD